MRHLTTYGRVAFQLAILLEIPFRYKGKVYDPNGQDPTINWMALGQASYHAKKDMICEITIADLFEAQMAGIDEVPVIEDIHTKVYEAIRDGGRLQMCDWHGGEGVCGTTHCRGGWVIHLAGEVGEIMSKTFPNVFSASLIYVASDPHLEAIPDFYCSNEEALVDIEAQYLIEQARKETFPVT